MGWNSEENEADSPLRGEGKIGRHVGFGTIQKEFVARSNSFSLQGHSVPDRKARPAHEKNQSTKFFGTVMKVAPTLPVAIGIGAINNALDFFAREIIGGNLFHTNRF